MHPLWHLAPALACALVTGYLTVEMCRQLRADRRAGLALDLDMLWRYGALIGLTSPGLAISAIPPLSWLAGRIG